MQNATRIGLPAFLLFALTNFAIAGGVVSVCDEAHLRTALSGGGLVTWACDGTITITSPLVITNDTSLDGSGHNATISGANSNRLFTVRPGNTLLLANLSLVNGTHQGSNGISGPYGTPGGPALGGAIYSENATIHAMNCLFSNNVALGGIGGDGAPCCSGGQGGSAAGGAVYIANGIFTGTNCIFVLNRATGGQGGGGYQTMSVGGGATGGAISTDSGTVQLFNCQVVNNRASGGVGLIKTNPFGPGGGAYGGGLYNSGGEVWILRSTFNGNTNISGPGTVSSGGAIYQSTGTLHVTESSITTNQVVGGGTAISSNGQPLNGVNGYGGGFYIAAGTLALAGSTLAGNQALGASSLTHQAGSGYGGGIYNAGAIQVTNCTLTGNTSQGGTILTTSYWGSASSSGVGGGLCNIGGSITVDYATISGNAALIGVGGQRTNSSALGGGLYSPNGTIALHGSIVASSPSGSNCFGTILDNGYNLSSDKSCNFVATGSLTNLDPKLSPLDNYGGFTPTMALLAGSPALDSGDVSFFPSSDQRGRSRPYGARCDIGAFESSPPFVARGSLGGLLANDEVIVTNGVLGSTTVGGKYSLADLAPGTYTFAPFHPDYIFFPTNRSFTVGPDLLKNDFQAVHRNTLLLVGVSNNSLSMLIVGSTGLVYRLQASSNLADWDTLSSHQVDENGYLRLAEPMTIPRRFYRFVTP